MCGIGGILRRDGKAIPEEWLDAIDARIAYRGPDGQGRFRDRIAVQSDDGERTIEVAFVHRRLSIIDHAGGLQPMVSERGRDENEGLLAVVFNGCIYNHHDLRKQLEAEGHNFASGHSDTEVLIHGYRQWGNELTEHLEGMYAFALWDRGRGALVLARDWFGEKPLYVRVGVDDSRDVIVFSSDARALAQVGTPAGKLEVRLPGSWTRTYFQLGYNFRGTTIFPGVNNLAPTIHEKIDALMPRRSRETHTQRDFEYLIEQAVARRLEADVPLGCFLSGGVDSSLIAHFAKQHKPDLRTFSVRMPDARYDESHHAEAVAAHLGTDHTTLDAAIERGGVAADIVHLIHTLGQPFGDSSILPTYWVSKAARQHVKVAISGDGGDELFLGYDRYMAARHLWRHRRLLQWIPARLACGAHSKSLRYKLARLGVMARDAKTLGIVAMESIFDQHQIHALLSHHRGERGERGGSGVNAASSASSVFSAVNRLRDPLQALRCFDLLSYLPDDLLCKVDTASMAVGGAGGGGPLEVRAPFLDRDLVRAALAAPTWQLVPGGKRKGLLREIARKYLPANVVDRPKMGFAIPIGEWFRNDFGGMRTLLLEHLGADKPRRHPPRRVNSDTERWLNQDAVNRLLDEHLRGEYDHGQRLFALLTLAIWLRMDW